MELCIPHRQRLQLDVVDKPMRVSSTGEKGAFRHPRNRYHTSGWELTQSHMDKPWRKDGGNRYAYVMEI